MITFMMKKIVGEYESDDEKVEKAKKDFQMVLEEINEREEYI